MADKLMYLICSLQLLVEKFRHCLVGCQVGPTGIARDKTMADKFMYLICSLQLLVEKFRHC